MKRLAVRSALVVPAQSLDEHPVWSPEGDALAFHREERWESVALRHVTLAPATWMGMEPIGVASAPLAISGIGASTVKKWDAPGKSGDRKVTRRDGTTIELKQVDLGTTLVVARPNSTAETLWSSRMASCYALSLSPNERLVAYYCEQAGLIVTAP